MQKTDKVNVVKIEILYNEEEDGYLAFSVGYGIEEEGLPYEVLFVQNPKQDAYELSTRAGLGVAIAIEKGRILVFSRLLKEARPIFEYKTIDVEIAKTIGKNSARIIKNKPFIDIEFN